VLYVPTEGRRADGRRANGRRANGRPGIIDWRGGNGARFFSLPLSIATFCTRFCVNGGGGVGEGYWGTARSSSGLIPRNAHHRLSLNSLRKAEASESSSSSTELIEGTARGSTAFRINEFAKMDGAAGAEGTEGLSFIAHFLRPGL
jgi:hypothetical protein